jgi:hypothetical protein
VVRHHPVTVPDLLVVRVVERQGLLEGAQVFHLPRPLPRPRDRRRALLTAVVTKLGELLRVALTSPAGADKAHAGQACDIADPFWAFHVHLLQRLLDPRQVPSGILDEAGPMPLLGAPDTDGLLGPEGRRQQAEAVQPLAPRAVVHGGLGPVRCALDLTWSDQQHLKTLRLQEVLQGDPLHTGRFHGARRHLALPQPGGDGVQSGGEGAEAADMGRQDRGHAGDGKAWGRNGARGDTAP